MMGQNVPCDSAPGAAVRKYSEAPVFDSQAYIHAWREHLGTGEPWDLTLPDGIAPLMRVQERHCRVPLRVLKPTGTWVNPANVVIPFRSASLDCLFSRLRERRSEWDALEFVVTIDGAPAAEPVLRSLRRHGLRLVRWSDVRRPYIRIENPWEVYYRQRSKNARQDIARRLNKMARLGGMRVECAGGDDGLHALEAFFTLHQKRWGHRGQLSVYTEESSRTFMRTFLARCRPGAWAIYSLFLAERVVATAVELQSGRTFHYYQLAMDPDFSDVSPGKVLVYWMIRDAFQKAFAEVDLGYGADGHSLYKAVWATGEYRMRRFVVTHSLAIAGWLKLEPSVQNLARAVRRRSYAGGLTP
jgi:CelD/BcsL family acetyltransferase involved in cellulose biosynthesis